MNIQLIDDKNIIHIFDPVKNIVILKIFGLLTPQLLTKFLQWADDNREQVATVEYIFLDFQDVTHFGLDNFVTHPEIYTYHHLVILLDELPIIYIVNNPYQEYLLQRLLDVLPGVEKSATIIFGWNDELYPVTSNSKTRPEMTTINLNIPRVSGYYDAERQIIHNQYYGTVTTKDMIEVFQWKMVLFEAFNLRKCRGRICDFRLAMHLLPQNHTKLNQIYSVLDMKYRISRLPATVIASNQQQARMVSHHLLLTDESQSPVGLFTSLHDAHQFITDFHDQEARS